MLERAGVVHLQDRPIVDDRRVSLLRIGSGFGVVIQHDVPSRGEFADPGTQPPGERHQSASPFPDLFPSWDVLHSQCGLVMREEAQPRSRTRLDEDVLGLISAGTTQGIREVWFQRPAGLAAFEKVNFDDEQDWSEEAAPARVDDRVP
jgi:hypothetical protein